MVQILMDQTLRINEFFSQNSLIGRTAKVKDSFEYLKSTWDTNITFSYVIWFRFAVSKFLFILFYTLPT